MTEADLFAKARSRSVARLTIEEKRRDDAYALPKLPRKSHAVIMDFARSALECDASSHRFCCAPAGLRRE